jgi:arylsulfatase A-like enzyme
MVAATQASTDKTRKKSDQAQARAQRASKEAAENLSWRTVAEGKSFFGQMAIAGGKGIVNILSELEPKGLGPVPKEAIKVPAQYPDIPQVREHIANHYNSILRTDYQLGQVVSALKADGLWNNTVIFLYSDHGSDLPRSKEFCYVEGLHVPLIIVAPGLPEVAKPGARRSDLVNLMDIAATSLALAGLDVPEHMDARNVFASGYARPVVFSSADRMSNVIDRVRSVMGDRYHYIRNFHTDRPLMNWGHREMLALADPEATSFLMIRRLAEEGGLTDVQALPYGPRVSEELYDLEQDPNEVVNLAADPTFRTVLESKRAYLDAWLKDTGDKAQYPRSAAAMKEILDRFPQSWLRSPEFSR